jgi:hypothetical protein
VDDAQLDGVDAGLGVVAGVSFVDPAPQPEEITPHSAPVSSSKTR